MCVLGGDTIHLSQGLGRLHSFGHPLPMTSQVGRYGNRIYCSVEATGHGGAAGPVKEMGEEI